jgi:magnesium transporter
VASAGAFLFKDKIIIVQADSVPIFEYGKMPLRGNTIPGVLLRLVYHATRHFLENLRIIRSISDSFENKMESSHNLHCNTAYCRRNIGVYHNGSNGRFFCA